MSDDDNILDHLFWPIMLVGMVFAVLLILDVWL